MILCNFDNSVKTVMNLPETDHSSSITTCTFSVLHWITGRLFTECSFLRYVILYIQYSITRQDIGLFHKIFLQDYLFQTKSKFPLHTKK